MHRKQFLLIALLSFGTNVFAQQEQVNIDWRPHRKTLDIPIPYSAGVVSPLVHDDRTVTIKLKAPEASSVSVVGLPGWERELSLRDEGIWEVKLGPLEPDIYIYRLKVDGVTAPDPNNSFVGMANQPPYSKLYVHGNEPQYFDIKNVPHGSVTRHFYHSDVTNGTRELFVYTPPGYDAANEYPVLYLAGGSGELAQNWMIEGRANFIMDNLLADGKVEPMLIVVPNNQLLNRMHPDHVNLTFDLFERDLKEHIIPFVDSNYSTIENKHGRALSGLSMGGRHTMIIGLRNLDTFGSFGIMSAGDAEAEETLKDFLNDPAANEKVDYLFVGQGPLEATNRMGERVFALTKAFDNHGIKYEYYDEKGGAHEWKTWRQLLYAKLLPELWR
ncbi:alpha/beta hydrolase-fold protein [Jiulongibacter sediminis]|jgi:enterochelin esterase family protein|uniref:alpha/beta hydrolase-fold protein n=1 Tax=Jiulongibacter sediminis TaxID=1605367 RepID=UPI0026EABBFC|nr:alpha/beta hydrolase-fold protein [Jiulongibacter sediminis]